MGLPLHGLPRPATQGSFCSARLWAKGRGSRRQCLSLSWASQEGRWQSQGLGRGAWGREWHWGLVCPWPSSSGSGICPLLASSGQARAQVSDTWGPESHAGKPNTWSPAPNFQQLRASRASGGGSGSPEPSSREVLPGRRQHRRRLSHQQG